MKSRKVKAYNASKSRTSKYKKPKVDLPLEASDDSDVNPDDLFHDEIDDFHDQKDDELSTDDELIQHKRDSSDEEEVLPITDDEKDESDDADLEGQESDEQSEEELPNRDAWGKKKSMYYSADFVDQDRGRTYREADAEAAKAEEEEALAIQKSVYHNINAENLGAHLFFESDEEPSEDEEKVNKDSATKQEIIKYLKKETKIFEYKALLESSMQKLKKFLKLRELIAAEKIKSKGLEHYVKLKTQILGLIIHNINMYYMLASTGKNPKHHPVHKRIALFKQFLEDLETEDQSLSPLIDQLLEKEENGEEIAMDSDVESAVNELPSQSEPEITEKLSEVKTKKKSKIKHVETENEKEVLSLIKEVKNEVKKRKHEEEESDQDSSDDKVAVDQAENNDEKRFISYQIAKNKGLVPHRKKEYRNPRVRHRMKYRKAQIRRKGQVRGVVKEIKRYEGEPTGINKTVVKSVKFK